MGLTVSQLVTDNARHDRVVLRMASEGVFPVRITRGRIGYYRCRLGQASTSELAAAIAQAEGYNVPGSIPARANNPGNLENGNIGYGTITAAGGQQITIYPPGDAGMAALENQINLMVSGQSSNYTPDMSIAQVGSIYSGDSSGTWANNVASALGVSPSDNFASQAGASGGAIVSSAPSAVANVEEDIDYGADQLNLPPWVPYAALGVGAYLVLDALVF